MRKLLCYYDLNDICQDPSSPCQLDKLFHSSDFDISHLNWNILRFLASWWLSQIVLKCVTDITDASQKISFICKKEEKKIKFISLCSMLGINIILSHRQTISSSPSTALSTSSSTASLDTSSRGSSLVYSVTSPKEELIKVSMNNFCQNMIQN